MESFIAGLIPFLNSLQPAFVRPWCAKQDAFYFAQRDLAYRCTLAQGRVCDLQLLFANAAQEVWWFADVRGQPTWLYKEFCTCAKCEPEWQVTALNEGRLSEAGYLFASPCQVCLSLSQDSDRITHTGLLKTAGTLRMQQTCLLACLLVAGGSDATQGVVAKSRPPSYRVSRLRSQTAPHMFASTVQTGSLWVRSEAHAADDLTRDRRIRPPAGYAGWGSHLGLVRDDGEWSCPQADQDAAGLALIDLCHPLTGTTPMSTPLSLVRWACKCQLH